MTSPPRRATRCGPHRDYVRLFGRRFLFLLGGILAFCATVASACPFCTALPRTLSDDLAESTAAVVARCESISPEKDGVRICRMRVTCVISGAPTLKDSVVELACVREHPVGSLFWLVGYGEKDREWNPPKQLSSEAVPYLRGLRSVPEKGPKRLEYFLEYLNHEDDLISADAYNEFAEASLKAIASLRDKMDRQWVIAQLRDTSVPTHRRRLCWTLLSQCGTAEDARLFDEAMQKRDVNPTFEPGVDAAIACFVTLGGEQALARIEREFLGSENARYTDSFAAINAIRVHGTELELIPRKRLAQALCHVLHRPELADLVIPDLARWEDWSAIDRMVELFESSTEETRLVKPAVVLYLKACPLPSATKALDRLRASDPKAVQSAESSLMLYPGLPSLPVPPASAHSGD